MINNQKLLDSICYNLDIAYDSLLNSEKQFYIQFYFY